MDKLLAERAEYFVFTGAVGALTSEHPLAEGIVRAASERGLPLGEPKDFRVYPGEGIAGVIDDAEIWCGTEKVMGRAGIVVPEDIRQVRRSADEGLLNSLLAQYHYLGYQQPVGEHLKYLVWAAGRPVACVAWGSAPRHLGVRDRFIGWSAEARRRHLRSLAYNTRSLIRFCRGSPSRTSRLTIVAATPRVRCTSSRAPAGAPELSGDPTLQLRCRMKRVRLSWS